MRVVVPVVSGERFTARRPTNRMLSGGHSTVVFLLPTPPEHGMPWRSPAVHVSLVHEDDPIIPVDGQHCGQGDSPSPVR